MLLCPIFSDWFLIGKPIRVSYSLLSVNRNQQYTKIDLCESQGQKPFRPLHSLCIFQMVIVASLVVHRTTFVDASEYQLIPLTNEIDSRQNIAACSR